jgi:hypothetical protein
LVINYNDISAKDLIFFEVLRKTLLHYLNWKIKNSLSDNIFLVFGLKFKFC